MPIAGVISDGQLSIRRAVEAAVPEVPHPRWHFHSRRKAAHPISEADRHAKKALKKHVRCHRCPRSGIGALPQGHVA